MKNILPKNDLITVIYASNLAFIENTHFFGYFERLITKSYWKFDRIERYNGIILGNIVIIMSSTFKNRIPKRKYRERAQVSGRQHLGLLEKKQDYKKRAVNYHKKEDMINKLKTKADLKNEDEFYFKMMKGKRNEEGKFVEESEDDSDYDEKQYRRSLKTENYGVVKYQRSIVQKVYNGLCRKWRS